MTSKLYTLLFFLNGDDVLLAMKKRGFGSGRWNGVGGKVESGESIEQAMVRESQEEVGLTPTAYRKVAEHDFVMHSDTDQPWHMHVHAFTATAWQGVLTESEEMAPQWFHVSDIPYADMWQDDEFWLPAVLGGKLLRTTFTFDQKDILLTQDIHEVESL